MDYIIIFFLLLSVFTWLYFFTKSGRQKSGVATRLPPGPYPLPIIGNILELGDKPHHSLAALSKTYGPLMSLKLGSITMIVVSSCEMAQEFFSKHDISFSSRSVPCAVRVTDSHNTSMVWLPVGDQWRQLRRICKEHLFSVRQLDASRFLRKQKVQELLDFVHGCRMSGKPINIGETAAMTALNVLSNYIFSTDLAQYDSPSSQEFKNMVWAVMEISGAPNLADYFPVLRPLDPHGLLRRSKFYNKKLLAIFEQHISERLHVRSTSSSYASSEDLTDLLLNISKDQNSSISLNDIRQLLFDLFLAGTDTTSNTLEWAMAELIHNPEKMLKARAEIKKVIGNDERTFEESDISRVPYLRAIIKETLRLHHPVTFLVPHKAITDVEIKGYMVPKDAQIMCNMWAMGQDPNVWSDPQRFEPERFLDVEIDFKGRDFEFIPFGAGRRMCPGLPLADIMLHLMLGTLIHKFDWKIEGGMRTQDMDMTDKFGFTLKKNLPLMAIPVKL
ncbi:putative geraniol 8-hydroxylase [Helianthus annuus]|nr:putative geraniol 8-hydroxylase [Helianthus annuus]KAJ0642104.1 putative geraniol 8-hydroxylase [Helianthus annuus]